jgi:hypothetical protein
MIKGCSDKGLLSKRDEGEGDRGWSGTVKAYMRVDRSSSTVKKLELTHMSSQENAWGTKKVVMKSSCQKTRIRDHTCVGLDHQYSYLLFYFILSIFRRILCRVSQK